MPWILNENEIQALLGASAEKRYKYFLNHVADQQELWGLKNDEGWVSCADSNGQPMLPLWPHRFYALKCAVGEWSGCEPQSISVSDWLKKWTPELIKNSNQCVAVFPIPAMQGTTIRIEQLEGDLNEELSQYE